jgi:hypothetical protein
MASRVILLLALTTAIIGCATTPVPNSEASLVSTGSVLNHRLLDARPGTSQVTIKRDSGFFGGGCSVRIFVNGEPLADIRTSEKVVIYLPEGDHMFGSRPNGICAGGTSEVKASVKPGIPLNLRVAYGSNGEFFMNVTAF